MTPFQIDLTKDLIDAVWPNSLGDVMLVITKGPAEIVVEVKLVSKGMSFWVYEDGASMSGEGLDERFEIQDYRDLPDLKKSFMAQVAKRLSPDGEHRLDDLVAQLLSASGAGEPLQEEVLAVRWSTPDQTVDRAARDAWIRLQHFTFDADTRRRDPEYDKRMRSEMYWRADELQKLAAGSDPYGRRQSFLARVRNWLKWQ